MVSTPVFDHEYLFAVMSRIAAEPHGWDSRFASEFLHTDAPALLTRLAKKLRTPLSHIVNEAWDVWRRPDILESGNIAARTKAIVKRCIRRQEEAEEAQTSPDRNALRDLQMYRLQLTDAARTRATAKGVALPDDFRVKVAVYGNHDDLFEGMHARTLIPGSDEHLTQLTSERKNEHGSGGSGGDDGANGTDVTSEWAVTVSGLRKQHLLNSFAGVRNEVKVLGASDEQVDDLLDAIASRLVINARGHETELSPDQGTTQSGAREAVGRMAETIGRDRPVGGNPDDTIAHLTGLTPATVRYATSRLLGGKRTLKANDKRRAQGHTYRIKPGVIQQAADEFDAR
jgi:hypothetical protein